MGDVKLSNINWPPHRRTVKESMVSWLGEKMKADGYNPSYPITVEQNEEGEFTLVDGGHRVKAAERAGIDVVPYVLIPDGVSPIIHALRCNRDGADTKQDDVFDLAELCASLSADGWKDDDIAQELGWDRTPVVRHRNIFTNLSDDAWALACESVPTNSRNGTGTDSGVGTASVTNGTPWKESHFRVLLKHLGDPSDLLVADAQMAVVTNAIHAMTETRVKVTAKWIEKEAIREAWYIELRRIVGDTLADEVADDDGYALIESIDKGVFGKAPSESNRTKLEKAIAALNEKALGIKLYHDDAFQRIPTFEDASIDLVIADPPYNKTQHEWDVIGTDGDYLSWLRDWLTALKPKLKPDYHLFMFCSAAYAAPIEMMLHDDGWPLKSRVVWSYRNLPGMEDTTDRFIYTWDMAFHCGTHPLNWSEKWCDERYDVQQYAVPQSNFIKDKGCHPTPKPVELVKLFVRVGSSPGDVVLDSFAGGGTTGAACREVGQRLCHLIEQSDEFCSVIETRLDIRRQEI